jgi:hypothetical protein
MTLFAGRVRFRWFICPVSPFRYQFNPQEAEASTDFW